MLRLVLIVATIGFSQVRDLPTFNAKYDTPAGWVSSEPKIDGDVATLTVSRIGLQPVFISFYKHATAKEALYHRGAVAAEEIAIGSEIMRNQNSGDPSAYIDDSASAGGNLLLGGVYRGAIGSTKQVELFFASSSGLYSQAGAVVTSEVDLTANYQNYFLAFGAASFKTQGAMVKVSASPIRPKDLKSVVDLLGRMPIKSPSEALIFRR